MRKKLILLAAVLAAAMLVFVGCEGKSDEVEETPPVQTQQNPPAQVINAPTLTMTLPGTLTGTLAKPSVVKAQEPNCNYPGGAEDPFKNAYTMTKFLVSLSQAQSCFADFVVAGIAGGAGQYIGKGIIKIGDGSGGGPKYLQIEKSENTYTFWLYFDDTNSQVLYMTWTATSADDATGQYIMKASSGVDSPGSTRVDFTRSADVDKNQIYIGFTNSTMNMEGFRIDVTQTGTGAVATYDIKGMISLLEQPFVSTLSVAETYSPASFKMAAVADSTGKGASIQSVVDYAMDFAGITNGTGYKLGTYNHTVSDRVYFTASGTNEWLFKSVPSATYINTSGTNARQFLVSNTPDSGQLNYLLSCLEQGAPGCTGIPPLALGAGYFTTTCTDANGADCAAFMQGLYDAGAFSTPANSDALLEPNDSRKTALDAAQQLNSVWPDGKDGNTAFVIPPPPVY